MRQYGLTYKANKSYLQKENLFYNYSDAAYTNTEEYWFTLGYICLANGAAITWISKKQTTVILSSTEAKYMALYEAVHEAIWIKTLYKELGYQQEQPVLILGDNNRSIIMAKNPGFHKQSKHIIIRWHWLQDRIQDKSVYLDDCHDPQNMGDICTNQITHP